MSTKVRFNEDGSWIDKHGIGRMMVIAREGQEVIVSDGFAEKLSKTASVNDPKKAVAVIVTREIQDPVVPVNDVGPKAKAERAKQKKKKRESAKPPPEGKMVAIKDKDEGDGD